MRGEAVYSTGRPFYNIKCWKSGACVGSCHIGRETSIAEPESSAVHQEDSVQVIRHAATSFLVSTYFDRIGGWALIGAAEAEGKKVSFRGGGDLARVRFVADLGAVITYLGIALPLPDWDVITNGNGGVLQDLDKI